jgi:hypothetical protein
MVHTKFLERGNFAWLIPIVIILVVFDMMAVAVVMLSNIVLNELDQELEKRGHRYCRWADDFVILLKSERAAQRVMEGITGHLENTLNLPVNKEKS